MVRPAEDDAHLLFASRGDCDNWTPIPVEGIEEVEVLDSVPCRDHTHPLVSIRLKEPKSEESKLFASLASAFNRRGLAPRSYPGYQPAAFSVGSAVAPGLLPGTSLPGRGRRGYVGPVSAFGRFEPGGGPIELPDPIPCRLRLRCASIFGYLVCWAGVLLDIAAT